MNSRDLILHGHRFLLEDLKEGLVPLELDDINPKPVIWELVSLSVKKSLAFFHPLKRCLPSLDASLDVLDISDEHGDILRGINGQNLKLSPCALDLRVKAFHGSLELGSKLAEDLLVPLVVLVVDLLLDVAIEDVDSSEDFLVFYRIKSLFFMLDLVEELSPLLNIFSKLIIDLA